MRNLILSEYVSLDGVIQAPRHAEEDTQGEFAHAGASPFTPDHRRYNSEPFQTAGAFLLGRLTYEIFAAYWPTVRDESDKIARALNTLPKYVAPRTLEDPEWEGTTVLRDVPREVAELKGRPGKPILVLGSANLAQPLIEHRLVDEYQLWLHPVVIGAGKTLFWHGNPFTELTLVDSPHQRQRPRHPHRHTIVSSEPTRARLADVLPACAPKHVNRRGDPRHCGREHLLEGRWRGAWQATERRTKGTPGCLGRSSALAGRKGRR